MKTLTVKAFVYFWVSDGRCDETPTVSQYRMSGANWVPVHVGEEGLAVQSEVVVQIPENFDWRDGGLKVIEREEKAERAAYSIKMQDLAEAREKLLAIEHTPSTQQEPEDDIPF